VEGDAQKPALAAGRDEGADVEERCGEEAAVLDDPNTADLFHDEEPSRAVSGSCDVHGSI